MDNDVPVVIKGLPDMGLLNGQNMLLGEMLCNSFGNLGEQPRKAGIIPNHPKQAWIMSSELVGCSRPQVNRLA